MQLTIYEPSRIFLDVPVIKIIGEGPRGSFGLLPRHIDFVTALVPGILAYAITAENTEFLAVKGGILVKQKDQVTVATRMAIKGELGELKRTINRFITEVDEREKTARTAVARLEASFIRRFLEMGKHA
jgi:F-type H+-transporting ATPase subunit epsilon